MTQDTVNRIDAMINEVLEIDEINETAEAMEDVYFILSTTQEMIAVDNWLTKVFG